MKVAILAGGRGTRLAEQTRRKPKALVEIGPDPIVWHLIQYYVGSGWTEFVIALGYKGEMIEDAFLALGFRPLDGDRPGNGYRRLYRQAAPSCGVELVDTGLDTQNGGRLKRIAPYLGAGTFMLTYCDGLSNVDLPRLLSFHRAQRRLATLTAVHPQPRFGRVRLNVNRVLEFREKQIEPDEWINGGFFVLEPGVLDYIAGDFTQLEREPLEALTRDGELSAYRHDAFWQCMDTVHDAQILNDIWQSGQAPWAISKE